MLVTINANFPTILLQIFMLSTPSGFNNKTVNLMSKVQRGNVASRPQTVAERKRTANLSANLHLMLVRTVTNCTIKDLTFTQQVTVNVGLITVQVFKNQSGSSPENYSLKIYK